MPDQDPLAGRFAAFVETSSARTQPPGVPAVRRTVARRRAGRILAVVAVLALVAGPLLWFAGPSQPPRPAESVSPSPRATVSATPSLAPLPTPSASIGSISPDATPEAPGRTPSTCSNITPNLQIDNTQFVVAPSDYFSRCPQARIRAYAVLYKWDVNQQEYALANISNVYFTAASPTAPVSAFDLPSIQGTCGWAFVKAQGNSDPPGIYPTSLTGTAPDIFSYWPQHGLGSVIGWQTNAPTPAELAASPACRPPGSSSSPTP